MGAWIEIIHPQLSLFVLLVAPFMGAWIEISGFHFVKRSQSSHPSWVRGLKFLQYRSRDFKKALSHPSWVRGLKYIKPPLSPHRSL